VDGAVEGEGVREAEVGDVCPVSVVGTREGRGWNGGFTMDRLGLG
jgi:hypothetical protein